MELAGLGVVIECPWVSSGAFFQDTWALGSPLIDAGMATTRRNTSNDVRGEPRPDTQTGLKDMGAYEVQQ